MKKFFKAVALLSALLILSASLSSCGLIGLGIIGYIASSKVEGEQADTAMGWDPQPDTLSPEEETDKYSPDNDEYEETTKAPAKKYDILCGLPDRSPDKTLICGDGAFARKYTVSDEKEFDDICGKYLSEGYTEYCPRNTENTLSATLVGGDTYVSLFFRKKDRDLVIVSSYAGGSSMPFEYKGYNRICETTFTQPGLSQAGGMCEIIRIADGRFIIFDSGNPQEADIIYDTLCRLNGSKDNIRIAAWVFSHSHGDHYGGFEGNSSYVGFADKYNKEVELEYVLYAPLAMKEWNQMESYNVSWNTIDHYFIEKFPNRVSSRFPEATLVPVHAGQVFRFADVSLEILFAPEHIYIDSVPVNSNNTSLACRVISEHGGAALLMADCETEAGLWVDHTYNSELQANIMQMTHHGMIADADLSLMKKSGATTFFWPSGEDKYNNTDRSEKTAKQYAARFGENILHGYGTMTRPLDHIGQPAVGEELLRDGLNLTTNGVTVTQNNSSGIVYTVTNTADPYIAFETNIDIDSCYNALVITVSGVGQNEKGNLYYTSGDVTPFDYANGNVKTLGAQGKPYEGFSDRKLIVYLGNGDNFTDKITSIRIDLGASKNATIRITSIQAFKL